MTQPVLQVRVQLYEPMPALTTLCPGYELKAWRAADLVQDVFHRHLASFALSYTEFESIKGDTAARSLSRAAQIVYTTDKYAKRGEFGELFLHAVARDFFNAQPAISKIYYKDSANNTVKGFDCVHVVAVGDAIEIWLGEVKFYTNLRAAIRDVVAELHEHCEALFLKREFVAITNKLDLDWPHSQTVAQLLDSANSLDEIVGSLVVPVLLTYDSEAVANHHVVGPEYITSLRTEGEVARDSFIEKFNPPFDITIQLILMPLKNKQQLATMMHEKLQTWQQI